MKYHGIRGIKKEVCTAEQKIAYNLAFAWYDIALKQYSKLPMQFQKSALVEEYVRKMVSDFQRTYGDSPKEYDIDAIFCALMGGFENYIKAGCPICKSFEEVGKMFPAAYLNRN